MDLRCDLIDSQGLRNDSLFGETRVEDPTSIGGRRVVATMLAAAIIAVGCAGAASPPSAATSAASATVAPASASFAPASAAASAVPSSAAPAIDVTSLEGSWISTVEDVRLNHASGSYVGGAITIDGDDFELFSGDARVQGPVPVGPTEITSCSATSCKVGAGFPQFITLQDGGTLAILDIMNEQDGAGAGICDAPVVPEAGVVTVDPDGQTVRWATGVAGGHGDSSGDDPCAGAGYQIVWTQVLTRAP